MMKWDALATQVAVALAVSAVTAVFGYFKGWWRPVGSWIKSRPWAVSLITALLTSALVSCILFSITGVWRDAKPSDFVSANCEYRFAASGSQGMSIDYGGSFLYPVQIVKDHMLFLLNDGGKNLAIQLYFKKPDSPELDIWSSGGISREPSSNTIFGKLQQRCGLFE
jgi:hypothetical protein